MFGDQSRKHQIKWMPGGTTIAWSNEKDFTDAFSPAPAAEDLRARITWCPLTWDSPRT